MKNAKAKEKNPMSYSGEMQHQEIADRERKKAMANAKLCQQKIRGKSMVPVTGYPVKTWKYV